MTLSYEQGEWLPYKAITETLRTAASATEACLVVTASMRLVGCLLLQHVAGLVKADRRSLPELCSAMFCASTGLLDHRVVLVCLAVTELNPHRLKALAVVCPRPCPPQAPSIHLLIGSSTISGTEDNSHRLIRLFS